MIKIRLIVVSAVAMVTLVAIGEPVVVVNGFKLTREALFDSAEKTMRFSGGRYDGLSGFDAWNRLVEDILLDFKIGTIATLELQSRGIKIPYGGYKQFDINDSRRYFPRSHVAAAYAQDYAVTMLAKGDFGSEVVDRSVKQQLVDRYQAKYSVTEIGLRDLLDSYGSVSTGTFVKGDNYEASLEELDKDAGMFTKCAYYIHRYTIRYYVIGLRWYVGKVDKMALGALVNGDKRKWEIIKFVGYFLLPYSLLMVIAVTTYRRSGGGMSFKPLFACVNFLYLFSIGLYYFGMSPVAMYSVFVLLPLFCVAGWILQPFYDELFKPQPRIPVWTDTNTSKVSPTTGEIAPEGKGYDTFGNIHDV